PGGRGARGAGAREADGECVVHERLGLVHERRRQGIAFERGHELPQTNSERFPLHGRSFPVPTALRPRPNGRWSIKRPMKPREEKIRVGGIDVHTWVGGEGPALLVLHGAGGNRGFTRWMQHMAERYTVWAPTHPGFGRSGDAAWMDGIDDLARFHLWFIDVAGLARPHLLGWSMGAWTAAEMATMSPGVIDRLGLGAPEGSKPGAGEIPAIFFHPPARLGDLNVYDPKAIPEWDELFGRPPTPADLDIAERNREMSARLTWKPYMHNPRLAHLPPTPTH